MDTCRKFREISRIDSIGIGYLKKYTFIPLQLEKFKAGKDEQEMLINEINALASDSTRNFTVENIRADQRMIRMSEYHADFLRQESGSLLSDPYLEETWFILTDYLELNK